ncbi:MAG: aminoacyl-tRNA hydrolase [Candidatus Electryoneaceae bacterium]|nr:aminoacyl-tRNA hydrolase [Candidatus Electryoneaceae bacterium]
MRLVVGLGNPGVKYRNTWHNLGARTVEELMRRLALSPKSERRGYIGAEWRRGDLRTMLMIPMAFMNRSGGVVAGWIYYFGVHPGQTLVVCDDHDLPLGSLRLRSSGSSGGHNGLKDVISRVGTDKIPRLRIGIKTDNERNDLSQ